MRRFLSVLLVLATLLSFVPIQLQSAAVEDDATTEEVVEETTQQDTIFDHITLFADGVETDFVELPTDDHVTLTALFDLGEDAIVSLAWQIYDPNGSQWVAISGADQTQLQVGYGMVVDLLDDQGVALLNCKITSGNSLYYSDTMQVYVVPPVASDAPTQEEAVTPVTPEAEPADEEIASLPEEEVVSEDTAPLPEEEVVSDDTAPLPEEEVVSEDTAPLPEEEVVSEDTAPLPEEEVVSEDTAPLPEEEIVSEDTAPLPEEENTADEGIMLLTMEEETADEGIMPLDDDTTSNTSGDVSGGELVTYTVTVKYTFLDPTKEAAQAYTATVTKGGSSSVTEIYPNSPAVVGYTPYVITQDGLWDAAYLQEGDPWTAGDKTATEAYATTDAEGKTTTYYGVEMPNLTISLQNITSDVTYRIVYLPNKVYYTVSHYCQNVINDEYELYLVEVLQGYVGEYTKATDLTDADLDETAYPKNLKRGFIALTPFKDQIIAADGTTQINTYYDRQYYLLTFKLDGGRDMDPIYARYGAPITVTDPVRNGYEFKGWYRLQMERNDAHEIQPRPYYDTEKKDHNRVYTNSLGQLLALDGTTVLSPTGGKFETMSKSPTEGDYHYGVTIDNTFTPCEPMASADMPKTMQYFHAAMIAVWQKTETKTTVVYWLEKADYTDESCTVPHTTHTDDASDYSDFAYWCSTSLSYETGYDLLQDVAKLEDPLLSGTGASASTSTGYGLYTSGMDLNGQTVVLYNTRAGKVALQDASATVADATALKEGDFSTETRNEAVEWTFHTSGSGYIIESKDQTYIAANGPSISLVENASSATTFTLEYRSDGSIYLSYDSNNQTYYLSDYGGKNPNGYRGYATKNDEGNYFYLYGWQVKTEYPDAPYYYYYYSDLRPLDENGTAVDAGKGTSICVGAEGDTIINVYFRRKEYNLRFFYARKTEAGVYQAFYSYMNYFCTNNSKPTSIDTLLAEVEQSKGDWANLTLSADQTPLDLIDPAFRETFEKNGGAVATTPYKNAADDCSYYYVTFSARYGEDISELWPVELFEFANMASHGTQVFSAFGGEYWIDYSRNNTNITIKGLMTTLNSSLLYTSAYKTTDQSYDYSDMGTNAEFAENDKYLDFFAYWEHNPGQYLFYLWTEMPDVNSSNASAYSVITTLPEPTINTANEQSYNATPDSTVYYDNTSGKYYLLEDVINTCDNNGNSIDVQTYPTLAGYHIHEGLFANTDSWEDASPYFYQNATTPAGYKGSYTLNFLYDATTYRITIANYNKGYYLDNIPYGSKLGAEWIKGNLSHLKIKYSNGFTPEEMTNTYYPPELQEGAYVFAGFYKTEDFLPGTEANLDIGMPNYNIILYVRWVPKVYSVEVYQTSELTTDVYFINSNNESQPMKSIALGVDPDQANLNYQGQGLQIPKIGTKATEGKSYGEYLPESVKASGPDTTVTDGEARIAENMSGLDTTNGTGEIRTNWIFVCWAYMEDGVEHAIDVGSYQIHNDVQIYAKWTATAIVNYRVEYQLANLTATYPDGKTLVLKDGKNEEVRFGEDGKLYYLKEDENGNTVLDTSRVWVLEAKKENGEIVTVADPLEGRLNEGANRTFTAKTDTELYAAYQKGYFPLTTSHTLLMEYETVCACDGECTVCGSACAGDSCNCSDGCGCVTLGNSEEHPLTTIFYYIQLQSAPYTVYYLDANGQNVAEPVTHGNPDDAGDSLKMVVTETYVPVEGHTADALQKTLILSANPAENKIVFNYTSSDGTPYLVEHYIQTTSSSYDYYDAETGQYYKLYYADNRQLAKDDTLTVDIYTDIPGYEYACDDVICYTTTAMSGTAARTSDRHVDTVTVAANGLDALTDALGCKVTKLTQYGDDWQIECDGSIHETHLLSKNLFYYTGSDGVTYEVRDIASNTDGFYTVTIYVPQSSLTVGEPGKFGTLVRVFYDTKYYPYFVYHKIYNTDETLQVIMGKALYQDKVTETSWSESTLISKGYPGYTMDNDKKTITMTMTMTIRDDNAGEQVVNTLTFYYYEKSIAYTYQPMVLLNPGVESTGWITVNLSDSNAQVSLPGQPVDAYTGEATPCEPYFNSAAYKFVGWFLDKECQQPVVADDRMYSYMEDNSTQQVNGEGAYTPEYLTTLASYTTIQPQKYVGSEYTYNELVNIKDDGSKEYAWKQATVKEPGVYVGAVGVEEGKTDSQVFTNAQTFYALFIPQLGSITITRSNLGANVGLNNDQYDQANSFVYRIACAETGVDMYVTIDPQDLVNGAASVTITNLPFGTYTVTQENDWSWRYSDKAQEVNVGDSTPYQTVTFGGAMTRSNWLSGFSKVLENIST